MQAAAEFDVEYTPIVMGQPGLFEGGAAFPGNDWVLSPNGEEYLGRIPAANHRALRKLRLDHLRFTGASPSAGSAQMSLSPNIAAPWRL